MSEIRVLVVEDEPLIAADIEQCLNTINFKVSAIAYSYDDAIAALKKKDTDVVLLDINLGEEKDGIDVATIINEQYSIPFIFLTSHADKGTLDRAKKVTPAGYIIKPFDERDLLAGLEIALYNYAQKQFLLQPKLSVAVINRNIQHPLSQREFEILENIYSGKTNQQMAESLFVSISTVKTHIYNIFLKLDVESRTAAIAKIRSWI